MIKQAARILTDNAMRYSPEDERITLRAFRNEKGESCLSVQDNGAGMSAQDVPHIFERFYRADPSHTDSGTGLGLAIAQSICQAHHAAIRAESGQDGTTFRVEIRKEQGEHHGN